MKTMHTAGASALAIVVGAGAFVVPAATVRAETVARSQPFASVVRSADDMAAAARRDQIRAQERRRVFPVRGAFNWGQEAAAFGGPRSGRSHEGQDVLSIEGTPEVAVATATVLETGNDGGRGNYMNLWDAERKVTYVYMHMQSAPKVKAGDHVTAGDAVGALGCTGSCDGPHLHFEVRDGKGADGRAHDPRPLLEELAKHDGIGATLPPGQG